MTRLRYLPIKHTELLVSKDQILCHNKAVNVAINKSTLVYKIYEPAGILSEGQGRSLTECKKIVKQILIALGANFSNEIRNRGKTEKL